MPLKKKKKTVKRKKPVVKKQRVAKKKLVVKKKPALKKKSATPVIGTVTHYFPHVRAAVIKLKATVSVGDSLKFKGHTTDFTQKITSMQIDHVPVDSAKRRDEIGLLVDSRVRQHDMVYTA
ncbi:MAG: translation elongation factor-like protein [Candidatus Omnitrophota bacterium]